MEIQSLVQHSHFICPSSSRLLLQSNFIQSKARSVITVLASERLQWNINGSCGNPRWHKFTAFSSTVRRRTFKGSAKQSAFFATRNGDRCVPEEDSPEDKSEIDSSESSDTGEKWEPSDLDWRAFRARLVASEQIHKTENNDLGNVSVSSCALGPKWAHPIPVPEPGCVLVATEKVDGQKHFERTVVLLLNACSSDPREQPFGVILNRPRQRYIKDIEPTHRDLAETFADCPLYYGGPFEASIFLLTTGGNAPTEFEEVISGLCYGARNSLHIAAELVRNNILQPQNFRFFLGFSGWESDQLKNEIASGYWYVAACSPDLIMTASASSSGLWEEILELMGGQYAELARKSKEDNP